MLAVSYLIFHMASDIEIVQMYDTVNIPQNIDTFLGVSTVASQSAHFGKPAETVVPLLQRSATQVEAFDEMFGLNGIIVQTEQTLDFLFGIVQNKSTTLWCLSKTVCKNYNGEMVYKQQSVYEIISKCEICSNHSVYDRNTGSCQCKPEYSLVNGQCLNTPTSTSKTCKTN